MNPHSTIVAFALLVSIPLLVNTAGVAGAQDSQSSSKAYEDADKKMMNAMMSMKMSGDADKDFVMMMIPHHQGAIDMAKVELQYGNDPALKKMAQEIIDAQQKEIDEFKKWQQEHAM